MPPPDPYEIILQGAERWNAWRRIHRGAVHFAHPHWYDCPDSHGVQVKGHNRIDFSGMTLDGISIHTAFAEGLKIENAIIENCHFEEGDFSRASFRGTRFRNTRFNKTIFTGAGFRNTTFINCNLNRVNLTGADFRVREISKTVVYGVSAWDLRTCDQSRQSRLVIEKTHDLYSDLIEQEKIPWMVDDIELAQFIHYLSNHRKIRDTLNILNDRGVLLLGRFHNGGLTRLDRISQWFRHHGYLPMIFDFERPDSLSFTETIITMAGLSKFVIADLSGPSVPAELQGIFNILNKPLLVFGNPYALLPDLEDNTTVITIETDDTNLLEKLAEALPQLESRHAERVRRLAHRYDGR